MRCPAPLEATKLVPVVRYQPGFRIQSGGRIFCRCRDHWLWLSPPAPVSCAQSSAPHQPPPGQCRATDGGHDCHPRRTPPSTRRPGRVLARRRRVPPLRGRPAGPPRRTATRSHRRAGQPVQRSSPARQPPSLTARASHQATITTMTCRNMHTQRCRIMSKHRGANGALK